MEPTDRYTAVCLQTNIHVADPTNPDPGHTEAQIRKNLARQGQLIDWLYMDARVGGPKLIVLSEFCLTGSVETRKFEDYQKESVYLPGWVTESLGAKARQHDCYIACNTYEKDDDWPGMVFNTSFIVGPDGDVVLKYRKNNASQGGSTKATNPGDIYDEYVARYGGPEALFPVVDTLIGRLACITCFDIRYPEVMRCLALQGAEVVVHCTAESPQARAMWTPTKRIRAWDNQIYLLVANNGDTIGSPRPVNRQWGGSRIVDFEGNVLEEAPWVGETMVKAEIDLVKLRRARAAAPTNVFSTNHFSSYAPVFADPERQTWPLSSFSVDNPYQTAPQMREIASATFEKVYERGQLVRPGQTLASNGQPYVRQYRVACLQTDVQGVRDELLTPKLAESQALEAIGRNVELIDWLCRDPSTAPRLVAFSALHLTGAPGTWSPTDTAAMAVEVDGWATEAYAAKARQYGLHVVGGVLERHPAWPGRFFDTAFLLGPTGEVLLRGRRLNHARAGASLVTSPGDLREAYVAAEGGDRSLFPVADTELGRIGLMVSDDLRFPEVARILALDGAEVVVHPTAESSASPNESWQLAKRIRAFDNTLYLVSVNNGATVGASRPRSRGSAFTTQVVDFRGEVLAVDPDGGESVVIAEIDLDDLRRHRSKLANNQIVSSRFGIYAPIYRDFGGWPADAFAAQPAGDRAEVRAVAERVLEGLYDAGVIVRPED